MIIRILAAIVAIALLLAYVSPLMFKVKDAALAGVILVGTIAMLVDLWHTLRDSKG